MKIIAVFPYNSFEETEDLLRTRSLFYW